MTEYGRKRTLGPALTALLLASGAGAAGALVEPFTERQPPKDSGRRAEKDAIALAKAQAKRERRAAKRMKESEK